MSDRIDPSDPEFQTIFSNACWGSERNPYHPEYDSSEKYYEEQKRFSNPWDNLIRQEERDKITNLDIVAKKNNTCENLKKARGSRDFYYCQILADIEVISGNRKFTLTRATKNSAEFASRCSYKELKLCTSEKHKKECRILQYTNLNPKD